MKNFPGIVPFSVVSEDDQIMLEKLDKDLKIVIQPERELIRLLAIIDRLGGAYNDCLQDRDEWKSIGEAVQRRLTKQPTVFSDLEDSLRLSIEACIRDHLDQDIDRDNAIIEASREIVKAIHKPLC